MTCEIDDFFCEIDYSSEKLKNDPNILEPTISFQSVKNHYFLIDEHYKKLRDFFSENKFGIELREKFSEERNYFSINLLVKNIDDIDIDKKIKEDIVTNFNVVINHNFFFSLMRNKPLSFSLEKNTLFFGIDKTLLNEIENTFSGIDGLETEIFNLVSDSSFVGWLWMIFDEDNRKLELMTTKNDDSLISNVGRKKPIMSIDFWEHSYLLDFFSYGKKEYINKLLRLLFDWEYISKKFLTYFDEKIIVPPLV